MKTKHLLLAAVLFLLFVGFTPATPPTAESEISAACEKAASQHKKVFLMFHASWCTVCKQMEADLNDPSCKKILEENYVFVYLDVWERGEKKRLENPGSVALMQKYAGKAIAMPYWLVLDEKGNMIADSKLPPDDKTASAVPAFIGVPSEGKELEYFINILKTTSGLNDGQLAVVRKKFASGNHGEIHNE